MKNVVVYPYSDEMRFYVDNLNYFRKDLESIVIVKPKSLKCRYPIINDKITMGENFEEAIIKSDCVIFLNNSIYKDILNKIHYIIGKVKKIICIPCLHDSDLVMVKKLCNDCGTYFEYFDENVEISNCLHERHDPYSAITTPVIAVTSLTKGIGTDDAVIGISKELHGMGYNLLVLSSSKNLNLYGFTYLPYEQLKRHATGMDELVVDINRYVNWCQMRHKADIVIVQFMDEGLIQWSSELAYSFGINAFIYSQAVLVDYNIMVAPMSILPNEGLEQLGLEIAKRFGFGIDTICFSDKTIDYFESKIQSKIIYEYTVTKEKNIQDGSLILCTDEFSRQDYQRICHDFVYQLS